MDKVKVNKNLEPTERQIEKYMRENHENYFNSREILRDLAYKDEYNKPTTQSWSDFWKSY